MSDSLKAAIARHHESLIALRRDLHQHPELAFEETRTADIVGNELEQMGYVVRRGVGKTGVTASLRGEAAGETSKTILLRADMDALPVQEANDVPYRSQVDGKMHACGHDGHVAIALTAARVLAEQRATLNGTVAFAFQPAEERASGALDMLKDGAMEHPRPDATIGLHLWSPFAAGTVGVKPGPIFASADEINITVRGKGGHGAVPHTSVDPIVVAAQIVTALQTLVSREIDPTHAAVVTVGSIHGGTAFNIIADTVKMQGTVRTYDTGDHDHLMHRIPELARQIAESMRATIEYHSDIGIPPCINDPAIAELVRLAAVEAVGEDQIIANCMQTVGDDMAYFLNTVPGCYFLVGVGNQAKGITAPHHSPHFDIDEAGLPVGVEVLTRTALAFLGDSNRQA